MFWFDNYSAGISLLCSALFEAIAIAYCYGKSIAVLQRSRLFYMSSFFTGLEKFCVDIESMIGFRPNRYWQICWKYITPAFLVVIKPLIKQCQTLTEVFRVLLFLQYCLSSNCNSITTRTHCGQQFLDGSSASHPCPLFPLSLPLIGSRNGLPRKYRLQVCEVLMLEVLLIQILI